MLSCRPQVCCAGQVMLHTESVFFFSQIFLSSLNNLHSGFSFSITFILVVITVAEDFECLIFFLWRAELWEFN